QQEVSLARAGALEKKAHKSRADYEQLLSIYERALGNNPGNHEVRRKLVDVCITQRRFAAAQKDIELLLWKGPYAGAGELYQLSALCYYQAGEAANAIENYETAIANA